MAAEDVGSKTRIVPEEFMFFVAMSIAGRLAGADRLQARIPESR